MDSISAVLDTCVLLPMRLCDTLLRAPEAGLYRPHWSAASLVELEWNLLERGYTPQQVA